MTQFLLDADVFISAKRLHYGFDFCPGYWNAIIKAFELSRLASIKPVRDELVDAKDDLTKWVKETCLLYTSPSPRDQRGSRMPSSA